MAVAHRTFARGGEFTTAAAHTTNLTTAVGDTMVVVIVCQVDSGADQVSGVTIGGVAATRERMDACSSTEPGATYIYTRAAAYGAGVTACVVTSTGTAGKIVYACAVTGTAPTVYQGGGVGNASLQTAVNVAFSMPAAGIGYIGGFTGAAAPTSLAVTGGTTDLDAGFDSGANGQKGARNSIAGAGTMTVGWTQASDDACCTAISILEAADIPTSSAVASLLLLGVGT